MAKAVQALQAKMVNRIILTRPGGRGGRAAGLPARHAVREDRPVPAPALRRAARHDRPGVDPQADGGGHDRGRAAGLHARPDAQRRVHHPRRGAEHHARADEDVPHPARASARRSWSPATSRRSTCPAARRSGLHVVRDILADVDDVHFSQLSSTDVVRHRLVADIVDAYARWDAADRSAPALRPPPAATGRRRTAGPAAGSRPSADRGRRLTLRAGLRPFPAHGRDAWTTREACRSRSPTSPASPWTSR